MVALVIFYVNGDDRPLVLQILIIKNLKIQKKMRWICFVKFLN